ncbi:MAG TPA: lactonase family protein [Humisphaera sp.]
MIRILRTAAVAALALLALGVAAPAARAADAPLRVYFGTYTGKVSKGVYVSTFDPATGKLSEPELAGETKSPSFLAIHPNKKFLYAVGEVGEFNGKKTGTVSAFAIDPATGKLTLLNTQSSGGTGPAHVSLAKDATHVLVANYGGGSVAALPVKADGSLAEPSAVVQHTGHGPNPSRQKEPHAHSINASPDGRFALAADLGLDKVFVYKLDPAKGALTPNDPPAGISPPGSGPRHLAFHPNGKLAFVINELTSTLTSFAYDAEKGALTEIQTLSTLPEGGHKGNSTAEVVVHPNGKFVYGSNRGHDSIAAFAVDGATGKLTPLGQTPAGVKVPRNFSIDPSGTWLLAAGQSSNTVAVFKIDPATGKLTETGNPVSVPACVCIRFLQP